jgi:adenylate cyclase
VAAELGVALSLVGSSLVNYATEGRQKRYLKSAFKQYLSPTVIEQLIAHPERLKLGGERRELSIYFSDLQGFTTLSEMLTPEELTTLLNRTLGHDRHHPEEGGTIDKYEGTPSSPLERRWSRPTTRARVRAALRVRPAWPSLRPGFRNGWARTSTCASARTRAGRGGQYGLITPADYTMLGDAVNLAARLEA